MDLAGAWAEALGAAGPERELTSAWMREGLSMYPQVEGAVTIDPTRALLWVREAVAMLAICRPLTSSLILLAATGSTAAQTTSQTYPGDRLAFISGGKHYVEYGHINWHRLFAWC